MDTHFQQLTNAYHERLFKQWLIITACVLSFTLVTLIALTITTLYRYTALKNDSLALETETTSLKSTLSSARKLARRCTLLKKNRASWALNKYAAVLIAISNAIPKGAYLSSLVITDNLALQGSASDLHELTAFTCQLAAQGLLNVTVEQSDIQSDSVHFKITASLVF